MSGGEERSRYRYPVWLGLIALVMLYLIGVPDLTAPTATRGLAWYMGTGIALLLSAVVALVFVATLASHIRQVDVMLTEHDVTGAAPLRRTVQIDFAAVEKLAFREIWSRGGKRYGFLEVHAPGRTLVLWDKAFRNRDAFDHMVATLSARVAAHGGPELIHRPASRAGGPFVA